MHLHTLLHIYVCKSLTDILVKLCYEHAKHALFIPTALAMQPVFISELLRGKISSQNSPKILKCVMNYILHQIFHPTNLLSPHNTGILEKLLNPANQIKSIKICHRYYHIGGLLDSDLNLTVWRISYGSPNLLTYVIIEPL